MIKNFFRTFLVIILIVTVPFPAYADFGPIQIDGYYDDWEDKPHMEVYNGNNPPESKINYVSLFRDKDKVYVHVIFARKNNQGITNMTIKLYTDKGNQSYFLFPDFWFNGTDMDELEMLPEESTGPAILEEGSNTGEGIGTENTDQSVTTEPESETESSDQTTDTESTGQTTDAESTGPVSDAEQEDIPANTEIVEQSPDTTDQSGASNTTESNEQVLNDSEQTDETGDNTGILYSDLKQDTYFVSDNNASEANHGQDKKRRNGTWSFTVWKNFLGWEDWEDWDDWDDWDDWEDWDDLFNPHDVKDWNNWFEWDDWSSAGSGYYTRNEGEPDELELCIPLSSITRNYDGITRISMKIKKLGQQSITCTGVDTGAYFGVAVGAGFAMLSVGAYSLKRKRPAVSRQTMRKGEKTDQC